MLGIPTRKVRFNGLIFQVPASIFSNQRFTVHPDGTGTSWDEAAPDINQPHGLDYRSLQDLRKAVRIRLAKEHKTPAATSAGGEHLPGGCRVLGIVENTADLSAGCGDKTGIDITDGLFQGRGIIYDQSNNALWCYTGDGTTSDDPYLMKFHPDRAWNSGDVTWAGAHEFDASVDISGNVDIDGNVAIVGDFTVDGTCIFDATGIQFGKAAGIGLFYDPTAYVGGETSTLGNGLIIKGGVEAYAANWAQSTITFGTAFPNACLAVVACGVAAIATDRNEVSVYAQSKTSFSVYHYDDVRWIAIGY
jgi:hypothetical protein